MGFRFCAKSVLLTYPQCSLSKEELKNGLGELISDGEFIIGRERHESGDPHLHAYIRWSRRVETRNGRYFDVGEFHPNIVVPRSAKGSIKYVGKDGDILSNMESTGDSESDWESIIRRSASAADFLDIIKRKRPKDYCLALERLEYAAAKLFKFNAPAYSSAYDTFKPPDKCLEWVLHSIHRPHPGRRMSLYIEGPSRIGKTEWARSIGAHLYLNNMYSLDSIREYLDVAEYAVFDDIPFDRLPAWKAFVGCQKSFTLTDRYRKKFTIQCWDRPSIFCVNPDMSYRCTPAWDYIKKNCITFVGDNKFY